MHRLIHALPPLAAIGVLLGAILWHARRIRRAAMAEAIRLGLETCEVKREILFSIDQWIRQHRCLRSRVALDERQTVFTRPWRVIQRPGAKHPGLPVGWKVYGLPNPLPPALGAAFAAVAEQWKDGLFEADGTSEDVCVFWDALGGAPEARAVREHIDRIVTALGEDSVSLSA